MQVDDRVRENAPHPQHVRHCIVLHFLWGACPWNLPEHDAIGPTSKLQERDIAALTPI